MPALFTKNSYSPDLKIGRVSAEASPRDRSMGGGDHHANGDRVAKSHRRVHRSAPLPFLRESLLGQKLMERGQREVPSLLHDQLTRPRYCPQAHVRPVGSINSLPEEQSLMMWTAQPLCQQPVRSGDATSRVSSRDQLGCGQRVRASSIAIVAISQERVADRRVGNTDRMGHRDVRTSLNVNPQYRFHRVQLDRIRADSSHQPA